MSFLYGDSSPSKLEINYVAFLREAIDLMVAILCAEERVKHGDRVREEKKQKAEAQLAELTSLLADVQDRLSVTDQTAATTRDAAEKIRQAAHNSIQEASAAVKRLLDAALSDCAGSRQRDRETIVKALESFLLHHDLPDTTFHHSIRCTTSGTFAELKGHAACGIDWVMLLDASKDPLFGGPLRVDRLAEGLEIQVPEMAGVMKKSLKYKAYRLSGKWLTEFSAAAKERRFKLRASIEDHSEGFDVTIELPRKVMVTKVGRDAGEPFEPSDEDASKLLKLYRDLATAAANLSSHRTTLTGAMLDGKTFPAHEDPTIVCERLVEAMAPVVKEIADHSMSREELVLKRIVGQDRREEIFCSKADLRKKIAQAPETAHGVFRPLGLLDGSMVVPQFAEGTAAAAGTISADEPTLHSIDQPASASGTSPPPRPRSPSTRPPIPRQ
jgi:hypothetical protein